MKSVIALVCVLLLAVGCYTLSQQQTDLSSATAILKPTVSFTQGDTLLPISYHNRWGFINQKGQVVIATKFRNVSSFADGLAPARLNGTYGYINHEGAFVIAPTYDYALPFSEGLARVWQNGQCHFIDASGKRPFTIPFQEATDFTDGLARITLGEGKQQREGLVDKTGAYVVAPLYSSISDFSEGYAVVEGAGHDPHGKAHRSEVGMIDKSGKFLVPFGKYDEIHPFQNGYAQVGYPSEDKDWGNDNAYIDTTGEIVMRIPPKTSVMDHYFSEGLIGVMLPKQEKGKTYTDEELINLDDYTAFFDVAGKRLINDPQFEYALPFQGGRTFAGTYFKWYLIDNTGKALREETFREVHGGFSNGVAIVQDQDEKWGVINPAGEYIIAPQFDAVHGSGFSQGLLLIAVDDSIKNKGKAEDDYTDNYRWGIVDRRGKYVASSRFAEVGAQGFKHGLLFVKQDSLYGYVDQKGMFVWSAQDEQYDRKPPAHLESLNIDFMLRGYCYAYDRPRDSESGGWAVSQNVPITIRASNRFTPNQLAVAVRPAEVDTFAGQYTGIKAYVYNTTRDTTVFSAQDSRLYLKMQAMDQQGQWRDIEYLPSSWCGNSYHQIGLSPNTYWQFVLPTYAGDFKTSLRVALIVNRPLKNNPEKDQILYSNTFPGSINPGQFWRKQGHIPTGIMDPYLE